ncbi:OPT superfamily oligopeptide transporter [Hypomontagnella monticulosa]|nr:OPT superfamily oligopeptide transporter [Hypomontagnella monticulosa]
MSLYFLQVWSKLKDRYLEIFRIMASSRNLEQDISELKSFDISVPYDEGYATSEPSSDYAVEEAFLNSHCDEPETSSNSDPFIPFDDLPGENRNILTLRAIVVGLFCGGLVNASNIYIGLKSGWTAGANIFGSIVGFAALKSCAKYCNGIPILGGNFGPRENNIVQTVATAAGGLSNVFVSAMPALYQLNLMRTPLEDFWRITILTCLGAYFGLFFATPLRRFFIIHAARELQLIFPSSYATATTIRSMHLAMDGARQAKKKMRALSLGFAYAVITRVLSQFAIGVLWDWHPLTWLYMITGSKGALALESWGWFIEWSPAFIGSGMLVGMNVSLSFVGGSLLAWGIIGPILVQQGIAFGSAATSDPEWDGYTSYSSLSPEFTLPDHPSPRYWLLWPGIMCMIAVSFTELACQWRIFMLSAKVLWKGILAMLRTWTRVLESKGYKRISNDMYDFGSEDEGTKTGSADPAPRDEQVEMWIWLPGLIAVLFITCVVMKMEFDMPVVEILLALFLAFFFSFLAIQATGATDVTPLTAASKASQIILGATTKGPNWTLHQAQTLNLIGGALSSIGANQAADLTGDFRVGFLLRTSPKLQWFAQSIGTLFAVFIAPSIFVLFSMAYPCILAPSPQDCPFGTPSVSAWRAVAVAVTSPDFSLPATSKWFSICFSIFGACMVLVRHCLWIGDREWVRKYHPNMMIISLAFLLPSTVYGTAMLIGASIACVWNSKSPRTFGMFGTAVAAGLMAGEGIGGVVNAVLTIMGVDFDKIGTNLLCPAGRC